MAKPKKFSLKKFKRNAWQRHRQPEPPQWEQADEPANKSQDVTTPNKNHNIVGCMTIFTMLTSWLKEFVKLVAKPTAKPVAEPIATNINIFASWTDVVWMPQDDDFYAKVEKRYDNGEVQLYVAVYLTSLMIVNKTGHREAWNKGWTWNEAPHVSLCYHRKLKGYMHVHHLSLKMWSLLAGTKNREIWGQIKFSNDMKVLEINPGSMLYAYIKLLQSYLGGKNHHTRLHISIQ